MTDQVTPALRVGVVGAGRVGAVLGAALRSAGVEISAVAAESDASRARAAVLLPGVPTAKPTAVARSCDLLLLTVPDDMLENVVVQLAASGALHAGQYVAHTSGRHGLAVLRAARDVGARPMALHPAMTFTGTPLDLDRLPGCAFGVTTRSDLRLLTVPDDMLENVVVQLAASGALHAGQYVAHTSGRHGLAVLRAARDVGARPMALHPAMTFTGTPLDLDRLPGCAFGVTT